MKNSILIIEDDQSYAEFLKSILIDNNYEASISDSAIRSLEKLEDKQVDIIISKYYLPNIRGDDFYKRLHDLFPSIPVIFISEEANKKSISKILSHRRADYLVKPLVMDELLARIEVLLKERNPSSNKKILTIGDLSLNLRTFKAKRGDKEIKLSPTEFSLLKYLILNKNKVLTRGMILNRIWGYNSEVESRVVDVYIGYLRDKIDGDAKKKLIKTVRGFGYRIQD